MGFLEQMYNHGVYAADLNAICITHDDTDHQQDMQKLIATIKEHDNRFEVTNGTKRPLYFLLSKSSYERWWERLPKFNNINPVYIPLTGRGNPINLFDGKVEVKATPTFNHFDIGDNEKKRKTGSEGTGVGLIFKLKKNNNVIRCLGITGDTSYCDSNGDRISPYFKECDTIILHISTVDDLNPLYSDKLIQSIASNISLNGFHGYYKKHLGFWGTISFIKDLYESNRTMQRLYLISEFGEELFLIRNKLTEQINQNLEELCSNDSKSISPKCYPTDIGTRINIEENTILCQFGKICPNIAGRNKDLPISPVEIVEGEDAAIMTNQDWRDRKLIYLCKIHYWTIGGSEYCSDLF